MKVGFTVVLLMSFTGTLSASGASPADGPDLAQTGVSDPPLEVPAGASMRIVDTVRNRGTSASPSSRTRYYLSRNADLGASDTRLQRSRSVPRLAPGRRSTGSQTAKVPLSAELGTFRLIACAGDKADGRERRARNDCLASEGRVAVTLPTSCQAQLARLGIAYSSGPQRLGVVDPVTIGLPLNGIDYFAFEAVNPQRRQFMDCSLALALFEMSETLKPRGITAVEHLGVYAYRCIAGTDPCVLSQHAHATAIDLHELRTEGDLTYNVETDWVIDPEPEMTCSAATSEPKDALLHQLACELHGTGLFNIVLTPNFNDDHRDHLHVDLTADRSFID